MEHLTSCLNPKMVRNKYTHEIICVPCGKCSACKQRKTSIWLSRLREESTCHAYTMFGTLTYDDSHLPRVCPDFVDDALKTDDYLNACVHSSDFIESHHGLVPCVSSKDIQDFFKRLRFNLNYYLQKNYGKDQKSDIRYFVVSEYGPTTFRPHYHMLLWFDNPKLYPIIKEYIYKAWLPKTSCSSLKAFLQRNKWKFVHGHCEEYCAGYLCTDSHLPEILRQKPFRTFHLQSSCPPIGTIRILQESVQSLLSGNACTVALKRPTSLLSVVVPLWRGIENRFFPKCLGFARISSADRRTLYNLVGSSGSGESFESFKEWLLREWLSSISTVQLVRSVCPFTPQDGEKFIRSVRSMYNLSRRISALSRYAQVTSNDYVSGIEAYYARKDYDALKMQLQLEEYMSNSFRSDSGLPYYPFLVDTLFYENIRELPRSTYVQYLEQFGLGQINDFMFTREFSKDFREVKGIADKIVYDNTKTRVKKDYVDAHPDLQYTYKDLLRSYRLINR